MYLTITKSNYTAVTMVSEYNLQGQGCFLYSQLVHLITIRSFLLHILKHIWSRLSISDLFIRSRSSYFFDSIILPWDVTLFIKFESMLSSLSCIITRYRGSNIMTLSKEPLYKCNCLYIALRKYVKVV